MAVDHSHLQHLTIWNSLPQPMVIISHARGHLRVSRFARRTTEKRETARSLVPPEKLIQPIRSTTQIWVISMEFLRSIASQTSFGWETSGGVAKCRLFSQANA